MTPEGYVKEYVKRILKKYHVYYFMPRGTSFGRSGVADFVCCFRGQYLEIETKAGPRCRQTAMQQNNERMVKEAGGRYLLIHAGNMSLLTETLEGMIHDKAEQSDDIV